MGNNFPTVEGLLLSEYISLREKIRNLEEENERLKLGEYGRIKSYHVNLFGLGEPKFEYKSSDDVKEELIEELDNQNKTLRKQCSAHTIKIHELEKQKFWTVVTFGLIK